MTSETIEVPGLGEVPDPSAEHGDQRKAETAVDISCPACPKTFSTFESYRGHLGYVDDHEHSEIPDEKREKEYWA